jgi:hypothetical protein
MSWLSRAASAARQSAVRLVPAERRDWAEAVWAEAREVPAGWPRLAWRAGGARLIVREARIMRRIGTLLVFAAAAGTAAWSAWPASSVSHAATAWTDIIGTVLLLAGLPLLARRLLGPPDSRAARWLRAGCYAAILALMPAKAVIQMVLGTVPREGIDLRTYDVFQCAHTLTNPQCHWVPGTSAGGPSWAGEVPILLLTACYLAAVLVLTARRTGVAPATLTAGAGAGLALGAVMYAWHPLGTNFKYPNRPWLHGSVDDLFVPLTWILLFGAPLVAGAIAGRRCHVPNDPGEASAARIQQGLAAGVVSGGAGALFVTVFGAGTTALLVKSAWVRGLLYHGQHLTASAVYGRELFASQDVVSYAIFCVAFPIIGFSMGVAGAGLANATGARPDGGHPASSPRPPGPPAPELVPDPPDEGGLADAGADQDGPFGRYDDGEGDQGPPGLVGAGLERVR